MTRRKKLIIVGLICLAIVFICILALIINNKLKEQNQVKINNDITPTAIQTQITDVPTGKPQSEYDYEITSTPTPTLIPDDSSITIYEEEVIEEIPYYHLENMTNEQKVLKTKYTKLLTSAVSDETHVHGNIKSVNVLNTSIISEVYSEVEFEDGYKNTYVTTYDPWMQHNYLRCLPADQYEFIMSGGNGGD